MMINIDNLSTMFGPFILLYYYIANILHGVDSRNRPDAYDENTFVRDWQIKVNMRESDDKTMLHVIIKYVVDNAKYVA